MMRIIYSGGYDKYLDKSIKNSFICEYSRYIKRLADVGKRTAFVTLAKPDKYYDKIIYSECGKNVDIIDSVSIKKVDWKQYHLLFLCGGDSDLLKKGLQKNNFNIEKLDPQSIVLGDSAGAYVLSSYYFNSPINNERGSTIEFLPGIYVGADNITIAHADNPRYTNKNLIREVQRFAKEKNLYVLELKENERRLLIDGKFRDFKVEEVFV